MTHSLPSSPNSYILKDMIDVAIPDSISWWPQTIGWKIIALLILAFAAWTGYKKVKRYLANRYRREALLALEAIKDLPDAQKSRDLSFITNQVAAFIYPQSAKMTGSTMLACLDALLPKSARSEINFDSALGQTWQDDLYLPEDQTKLTAQDIQKLEQMVEAWINLHIEFDQLSSHKPLQAFSTQQHSETLHV